jgi:hypothetical protein
MTDSALLDRLLAAAQRPDFQERIDLLLARVEALKKEKNRG